MRCSSSTTSRGRLSRSRCRRRTCITSGSAGARGLRRAEQDVRDPRGRPAGSRCGGRRQRDGVTCSVHRLRAGRAAEPTGARRRGDPGGSRRGATTSRPWADADASTSCAKPTAGSPSPADRGLFRGSRIADRRAIALVALAVVAALVGLVVLGRWREAAGCTGRCAVSSASSGSSVVSTSDR